MSCNDELKAKISNFNYMQMFDINFKFNCINVIFPRNINDFCFLFFTLSIIVLGSSSHYFTMLANLFSYVTFNCNIINIYLLRNSVFN